MKRPSISLEDWRARVVEPVLLGSLFFTLIHAWILTFYYQVPYNLRIGWIPIDGPASWGDRYSFGVHFFSDYTYTHIFSLEKAPWSEIGNNYPPFAVLLTRIFSTSPERIGLFLFLYAGVIASLAPIIHATFRRPLREVFFLVGFCGIASAGLIAAFDRGNEILFIPALLYFAYYFLTCKKEITAGILLGLAISLKLYPLLLLPLLLLQRKFKVVVVAIFAFIISNVLSALVWGNLGSLFSNLWDRVHSFGTYSTLGDPSFMSASSILANLSNALHPGGSRITAMVVGQAMSISIFLYALIIIACVKASLAEIFLFGLISLELIPKQSFSYTRIWTLAAVAILLSLEKISRNGSEISGASQTFFSLAKLKLWWVVVVLFTTPLTILFWGNSLTVLCGFLLFLYLVISKAVANILLLRERFKRTPIKSEV